MAIPAGGSAAILVADDEPDVRDFIRTCFEHRGYKVDDVSDGEQALNYLLEGRPVAAVFLDLLMPIKNGLDTLKEIRAFDPDTPVVMLSAASSTANIVEAMRRGANDFVAKPVGVEELRRVAKAILEAKQARTAAAPERHGTTAPDNGFFTNSESYQQILQTVSHIASADVPVLILGETGVGKEVLAKQLHATSRRAQRKFHKVNCAALPSELVESELFGYERGAFTGAFQRKLGMFELADGGTLMLDEIGDMDLRLQSKLLQVLQDQEFYRVGGKETVRVNVRVLAATHRDLELEVEHGRFRADLYYRLNVVNFRLPALRERREDIVPLAEFLLRKHSFPDSPPRIFSPSLVRTMLEYSWPGNIRELENVIRRFAVLGDCYSIERELKATMSRSRMRQDAHPGKPAPAPQVSALEQVSKAKQQAESDAILSALNATRWNRKKAARLLGVDYKALLYKMKKLGIDDGESAEVHALHA